MRRCALCNKQDHKINGPFFSVPKDLVSLQEWSELCGIELEAKHFICGDHFLPDEVVSFRKVLLQKAKPFFCLGKEVRLFRRVRCPIASSRELIDINILHFI